jgi:hypothetical protein
MSGPRKGRVRRQSYSALMLQRILLLVVHLPVDFHRLFLSWGDTDRGDTLGDPNFDVQTGTCSLSTYRRRTPLVLAAPITLPSDADPIPDTNWRGNGVGGGWDCIINGDCSFLSRGEERNWWFTGEEEWDSSVVKPKLPEGGHGGVPYAGAMGASQAKI